ncbi:DNA-binding protein D-ETS-6, partial [Operophtera brumata]
MCWWRARPSTPSVAPARSCCPVPAADTLAPRHACMEPERSPPPPTPARRDSDYSEDSGDETVPADPEKWERRDVVRCVRWVARTFSVRAPRRHLLPASGRALLQLTLDNWLQVCSGSEQAARIYHAYLQHAHASATGRAPPPPLPEHQAEPCSSAPCTPDA